MNADPEQEYIVLLGFYEEDFFMLKTLNSLKLQVLKSKALILLILLVLPLLSASIITAGETHANKTKEKEVLAAATTALALAPSLTPTQTPTVAPSVSASPTPIPTATPTTTPTPTVTPTPAKLNATIGVDYAGQKSGDTYIVSLSPGQTAWEVVSQAIGVGNLAYTDYGGDMGIFITGFNGINAASNQYFEFRVNGVSSNTGVSGYQVNEGDKLEFVLTTF
jgi:hypothetical protein